MDAGDETRERGEAAALLRALKAAQELREWADDEVMSSRADARFDAERQIAALEPQVRALPVEALEALLDDPELRPQAARCIVERDPAGPRAERLALHDDARVREHAFTEGARARAPWLARAAAAVIERGDGLDGAPWRALAGADRDRALALAERHLVPALERDADPRRSVQRRQLLEALDPALAVRCARTIPARSRAELAALEAVTRPGGARDRERIDALSAACRAAAPAHREDDGAGAFLAFGSLVLVNSTGDPAMLDAIRAAYLDAALARLEAGSANEDDALDVLCARRSPEDHARAAEALAAHPEAAPCPRPWAEKRDVGAIVRNVGYCMEKAPDARWWTFLQGFARASRPDVVADELRPLTVGSKVWVSAAAYAAARFVGEPARAIWSTGLAHPSLIIRAAVAQVERWVARPR